MLGLLQPVFFQFISLGKRTIFEHPDTAQKLKRISEANLLILKLITKKKLRQEYTKILTIKLTCDHVID